MSEQREVRVTPAQVDAAKLLTSHQDATGEPVRPAVRKIAGARPERGGYAAGEVPVRELVGGGCGVTLAEQLRAPRRPGDPLTPDETRALLRECVTVVKPGETLVVRVPSYWTPTQLRQYSDALRTMTAKLGFSAIAVVGEELGVAQAPESGAP